MEMVAAHEHAVALEVNTDFVPRAALRAPALIRFRRIRQGQRPLAAILRSTASAAAADGDRPEHFHIAVENPDAGVREVTPTTVAPLRRQGR